MTSASKTRLTNSPNPPVTSAATPSFREPREATENSERGDAADTEDRAGEDR